MPDYYLISEVYDEERTINPSYCDKDQPKPKPINLLLPSVHASRDHNILLADVASVEDPHKAVSALVASCRDSCTWPSSGFSQDESKDRPELFNNLSEMQSSINDYFSTNTDAKNANIMHSQHNSPTATAYSQNNQPPLGNSNYNASDPSVLEAARSLFFERKKQMALYGMPSPAPGWPQQRPLLPNRHQGPPALRMPSEYEMFTAWACLSRSEKQSYIHEVTNVSGGGGSSLEAGRAVRVLFNCCQDSWAWPSLQYLKAQESFIQRQLSYQPY